MAQAVPDSTLTAERAVALARANSPRVAAASGRRQAVLGRAREDAAFTNPTFEWRRENLDSPLARDQFSTFFIPIDITGRHLALRGATRAADLRSVADSATAVRQVELDAARAYWRAALARGLLATAAELRDAADRMAAFDVDRARAGAVAEVSAMRAAAEADRVRLAEAAAQVEYTRAMAELGRATGVAVSELPPPAEVPLWVERGAATMDAAALLGVARAGRTELAAARAAVNEARRRLSAVTRGALGEVSLQAGTKETGGYNTRVIGFSMPIPIFNPGGPARSRAQGELRVALAELRAAEQAVDAEVHAAVGAYRTLVAAAPQGADRLDARSAEVLRIAEAAYREGGVSLLELTEARRARAEIRAAILRWAVDMHLAQLELAHAAGLPVTDAMEIK